MDKIIAFLTENPFLAVATCEGDQPRVRIFSAWLAENGKIYLMTGKSKSVFKQILKNPKTEICAVSSDGSRWLRIDAVLESVASRTLAVKMLEKYPQLKAMYSPDDGNMVILHLKNATAEFFSMTSETETIKF